MRYKKIIVFLLLFCIVLANCNYIAHAEQGGGLLADPDNITVETTDESSGTEELEELEELEEVGETEETDAITEAEETEEAGEPEGIEESEEIMMTALSLGDGTEENPFIIYDTQGFLAIGKNLTAFYRLGADIDFNNQTITPIGLLANPFRGTLDGNGYTIKNFKISIGINYVGLFGYATSAKFKNLVIENTDVRQNNTNTYIGALAGYLDNCITENISLANITINGGHYAGAMAGCASEGSITGCSVKGNISVNGQSQVGGIAGRVVSTQISDCSVEGTGRVYGTGSAGGLVGDYSNGGTITHCFAAIETIGGDNTGGLIGRITGSSAARVMISECYATGSVRGKFYIGGLIGYTNYTDISNSYSTGNIINTANTNAAASFACTANASVVTNCYSTGSLSSFGSGFLFQHMVTTVTNSYVESNALNNTYARTREQLFLRETYVDWDFENVWSHQEGSYPTLNYFTVSVPEEEIPIPVPIPEPFDITFRDLTSHSVVIEWPEIPEADGYEITGYELCYLDQTINITEPQAFIEHLAPDTEYEFIVRAVAGSETSPWSEPLIIRTKKMSMGGLHSTNKTGNSITLTWNEMSGVESYEVMYQNKVIKTNTNTVTLTGLLPDTSYVICVKAIMTDGKVMISKPIIEKIYTLDPQTDYAREFINQCEGQTWFIDEIENILNLKGKSINSLKSKNDLANIVAINLPNRGLSGEIPSAIGELSNLEYLYLADNHLSGELPDELYLLIKLVEIDLSGNQITLE